MSEIQQEKFNEIVYFALETFQAAHKYHPTIVQSYLNNFINHPFFSSKRIALKIYEQANLSAEEYAKSDLDYRNVFNHFKWTIVDLLNDFFDCKFKYTGKLFFPDYEVSPPEPVRVSLPQSRPEKKKKVIQSTRKIMSSFSYITRNIIVIAALLGLGVMVGAVATMAGLMIIHGQFAAKGILMLIGIFFVCLIAAIITVYTTD